MMSGSQFATGSVLLAPNPLWPTLAPGQLDLATRLVPEGEPLYRLTWELQYHNGKTVRQYTRCGGQVFQVRLKYLDTRGAKELRAWDPLLPRAGGPIQRIPIPHGATPQLVVTSTARMGVDDRLVWHKIYTFGWFMPADKSKCRWHHIDPDAKRIVINENRNKWLPWG